MLWNFFPSELHREPPPLPRPRKYPRTTDSIPPVIPRQDGHAAERPESSGQWPRFNSRLSLQAAESNMEAENIPRRWCHIGTRISKAADSRIPPSFDAHGQDSTWIHANITAISHPLLPSLSEVPKSHPSSPLSDLPMDMEVELPLEEPKQHANNNKPRNKKRKREKAEIGAEITPQAVQADRPQLRRSARTHKPRK
ncbi:hypothetical protein B0H13DRAFT_1890540 [Mycena leptocephala]|nr:hypothetical protein B0H13DRAFT_1890540 [Mycena leptocephala]